MYETVIKVLVPILVGIVPRLVAIRLGRQDEE